MVKLVDFGLSTLAPASASAASAATGLRLDREDSIDLKLTGEGLTKSGFVIGTPMYVAPECIDHARSASPPTDIYSFGVIAYELFTGSLPFDRPPVALAATGQPLTFTPLATACPELPAELCALIDSCLAEDPGARPDASTLVAQLGRWTWPA